jgi:hypothetical protein
MTKISLIVSLLFLSLACLTAQDTTGVVLDSIPPASLKAQKTRTGLPLDSSSAQIDTTLARIAAANATQTLPSRSDTSDLEIVPPSANPRRTPLRFFTKGYPSPQKALLFSAILPGAGQAYNKQYWKMPIAYGAIGAFGYFFYENRKLYNRLKTEYIARVDQDPNTVGEVTLAGLSDSNVRFFRDKFRGRSEQMGLGMVVAYLLTGAEAYVGAHLKSFDVSDDLSMRIGPAHGLGVGVFVTLDR